MSYSLTADIEDIGRTEAKALIVAILMKHGLELVEEECRLRRAEEKRKREIGRAKRTAMSMGL